MKIYKGIIAWQLNVLPSNWSDLLYPSTQEPLACITNTKVVGDFCIDLHLLGSLLCELDGACDESLLFSNIVDIPCHGCCTVFSLTVSSIALT